MMPKGIVMLHRVMSALAQAEALSQPCVDRHVMPEDYPRDCLHQYRDRGNRPVSAAQLKRDAKKRKNIRKRKK